MRDRHIPFEGVGNFRDFGGYDTADGARIARGKLYRSAAFHEATDADIGRLDALGCHVVVDLRRPNERAREPNKWPGDAPRTVRSDAPSSISLPPHLAALLQDELSATSVQAFMSGVYREFPFDARHVDLYTAWFRELQEASGPVVLHCAAGKDRTGLGCALTLHALGVGEEAIFADYELTNAVIDVDAKLPRVRAQMEATLGRAIPPEALRPMVGVRADYLRAAFDEIAVRHGSLDGYLEGVLGVGAERRAVLRARLTT